MWHILNSLSITREKIVYQQIAMTEPKAIPQSSFNVLVADDDPIFRSLIEAKLTHFDCRLLIAADGGTAWQVTRQHDLDLAIIDFEMPGLDGIALIRCLRTHPRTKHIPIVMCTSRADTGAMQTAIEAGASSFLTKPLNWSLFEQHIEHLLHLSTGLAAANAARAQLAKAHEEKDKHVSRLLGEMEKLVNRSDANGGMGLETVQAMRTHLRDFVHAYSNVAAS